MENDRNNPALNGMVFIGKAAAVGLISGLILAVIYCILSISWVWPSFMYYYLWQIQQTQAIASMFMMAILTGIFAIMVNYSNIKRGNDSFNLIPSTVSGIVSGIVMVAPQLVGLILYNYWESPPGKIELTITPLPLMLASLAITAASAVIYSMWIFKRKRSEIDPNAQKANLKILLAVSVMIPLVIAAPPVITSIMVNIGLLNGPEYTYDYTVAVVVDRSSNDTITLKNCGGQDADKLDMNFPFTILINGRNVSDSDAIKTSGLSVTISPANGLECETGSSVNITGIDVMPENLEYRNSNIQVIAHYKDGKKGKVLESILNNDTFNVNQ